MGDSRERSDDEHVAAALDHVGQARAHRAPHAEQVHLDRALEGLGVHRPHHPGGRHAGVGHHHVDAAEALHGRLDRPLERVHVGHVGLERRGVRSALLGHAGELLRLEARRAPRAPRAASWRADLRADTPRGAGDQDGLATQVHGRHSSSLASRPVGSLADLQEDLSPEQASELAARGEVRLVDVRETREWDEGRIAGARHVEMDRLSEEAGSLAGDPPVVFYCRSGASLRGGRPRRSARRDSRRTTWPVGCWPGWSGGYRSSPTTAASRSTSAASAQLPLVGPAPGEAGRTAARAQRQRFRAATGRRRAHR